MEKYVGLDTALMITLSWWCLGGVTLAQTTTVNYTEIYCFTDKFSASCNSSQVIYITQALFGRMMAGVCGVTANNPLDCFTNVFPVLAGSCSGRQECLYPVSDLNTYVTDLIDTQPWLVGLACSTEHLSYLNISYSCLYVEGSENTSCATDNETYLPSSGGWVASMTYQQGTSGTLACPWVVTVEEGQTVRLTILDYTVRTGQSSSSADSCAVYIIVEDSDGQLLETNICGSSQITSQGNTIRFYISSTVDDVGYFLIEYTAIGCPFFEIPPNTYAIFEPFVVYIGCNKTSEFSSLTCIDNQWIGTFHNCSEPAVEVAGSSSVWSIVIAVAIGIAIGVIVGLGLLGMVYLCRRCFCRSQTEEEEGRGRVSVRGGPPPARMQSVPGARKEIPPMEELISAATAMAKGQRRAIQQPEAIYYHRPGQYNTIMTGQYPGDYQQGPRRVRRSSGSSGIYSSASSIYSSTWNGRGKGASSSGGVRPSQSEEHIYERYTLSKRSSQESLASSGPFATIELHPDPTGTLSSNVPSTAHPVDNSDLLR